MTINELFNMPRDKATIKKIDLFLQNKSKSELSYHQAVCLKSLCLLSLNKVSEALKPLLLEEKSFNNLNDDEIVIYSDTIKEIYFSLKQYDKALKYINIKKSHLSMMAYDSYYKDMILYNLNVYNYQEAKRFLLIFIDDDISQEDKIFAYEKLIQIQFENKEISSFYASYDKLISLFITSVNNEGILRLKYLKAQIMLIESKYDELFDFIREFINDDELNNEYRIELASILIDICLKRNEIRRASILDSEYESLVESLSPMTRLKYYTVSKRIYEALNNRFVLETIEQAINLANVELEGEKPKKEKKAKTFDDVIIEDDIEEDEVTKKGSLNLIETYTDVEITPLYAKLIKLINEYNNRVSGLSLRDRLRNILIEYSKDFILDEAFILFNDFKGYHYKMERLYDKSFNDILDTYLYESFKDLREIVIKDGIDLKQNPLTHNTFEYKNLVSIPFTLNQAPLGAICYVANDINLIDSYGYEAIKLLHSLLSSVITEYLEYEKMTFDNKSYIDLVKKSLISTITISNDRLILDDNAKLLFDKDSLSLNDFLDLAIPADRIKLNEGLNSLKSGAKEITLDYELLNGKFIRGQFFLSSLIDGYTILSVLHDITDDKKALNTLDAKSKKDYFSSSSSLNELNMKLNELYLNKSFSFLLLEAKAFKLYRDVYGIKFSLDLVRAIVLKLKEILISYDGLVYHYEGPIFIVILNGNDDRKIKRISMEILNKLSTSLYEFNSRLSLSFACAIMKINKESSIMKLERIIERMSYSIETMMESSNSGNEIMLYNSKESDKRFYEFQMELHISESIDQGRIGLVYEQIASLSDRSIYAYEAKLSLSEQIVDEKYFNEIARKRHLEVMLDKYLITHSLMELKQFYNQYKGYYKLIIKLNTTTLLSDGFIAFLAEKLKFLSIPAKVLSFRIINDLDIEIDDVISNLQEHELELGSSDLSKVLYNNLDVYYAQSKKIEQVKLKSLLDLCSLYNIKLILMNVESKGELDSYQSSGFNYIKGNVISKKLRINDIIESYKK